MVLLIDTTGLHSGKEILRELEKAGRICRRVSVPVWRTVFEKATKPYERMGEVFTIEHNFYGREARDFTGAEYYSLPERIMVGMAFRTIVRRIFNRAAKSWGCKDKLDAKPYKVSGKT